MRVSRHPVRNVPRSGYTLVELMIAVGLSAILMAALYKSMDIYLSLQLDSHEEISRQQVARAVLRQMTRDIQSVVFTKQEALPEEEEEVTDILGIGITGSGTSGLSGTAPQGWVAAVRPAAAAAATCRIWTATPMGRPPLIRKLYPRLTPVVLWERVPICSCSLVGRTAIWPMYRPRS
ncbi:MAG UNVERIFIED_CONTAM: prepilin-type N-terminal cleavage/methylation domain-containing protein [Planctomycetaceae bacterium]